MGLRFRKSVRFGRFVRLNFSGSGVSLGLGPRGANINISKRGVRQTVGIPGTGLSYQTFSRWQDSPPRPTTTPADEPPQPAFGASAGRLTGFAKFLVVIGMVFGGYMLFRSPSPPPATATPAPGTAFQGLPAAAASPTIPTSKVPQQVKAPDNRPLTVDEVREVQNWLRALFLDPGPIDGLQGPLTTAAIKKYEAARQRPVTGVLDRQLLDRLRQDTGGPIR
jgi:hypothetical protein